MPFQISALPAEQFQHLFALDDAALAAQGVERVVVDSHPDYPCRVSLADIPVGKPALLLNYEHQPAHSPYRSRHAIFVQEHATQARPRPGDVPDQLRRRLLSIRAFNADGMIIDGDVVDGADFEQPVQAMFAISETSYLHVHNAKYGCYAARVDRV